MTDAKPLLSAGRVKLTKHAKSCFSRLGIGSGCSCGFAAVVEARRAAARKALIARYADKPAGGRS